jgi:peroxiredoxin Q/BCP
MTEIAVGSVVPEFALPSTSNKIFTLSECRSQPVIVYFYPRDNTPGCTQEGQDFRDNFDQFKALNAVIVGISRDSVRIHEGFKAKHGFPFELLSDSDERVCNVFEVMKQKNMYGKQVRGIERSTFLINGSGVLIAQWRKVKVAGHCADVLQTLNSCES